MLFNVPLPPPNVPTNALFMYIVPATNKLPAKMVLPYK